MSATASCDNLPSLANVPPRLQIVYPEAMRDFVRYDCDPAWTPEECIRQIRERFPEPYPAPRTISHWREAVTNEREAVRREVWVKHWARRAGYLVPKLLVALDETLDDCVEVRQAAKARGKEGESVVLQASQRIKELAGEMLTHLGAPSQEAHADPEAIKREALAALMAAGQSAEQAESVFAAIAGGAQAALQAGGEQD